MIEARDASVGNDTQQTNVPNECTRVRIDPRVVSFLPPERIDTLTRNAFETYVPWLGGFVEGLRRVHLPFSISGEQRLSG